MKRARTTISKENRRQFILSCAEEIISKEGLSGLSLQSVAKKSNLAIGTIYLYFEKKEDLIAHLTLKSRKFLLNQFRNSIQNEADALQQISNILISYYRFYISHPHYNQLVSFFESNAGLEEPEELLASSKDINDLVTGVIKNGKNQGLIRNDLNEESFSFLLWGCTVGIIQLIDVKKSIIKNALQMDEATFFNQHISLIINSIKSNKK